VPQISGTPRLLLALFVVLIFFGIITPPLLVTAVFIGTHEFSAVVPDWALTIVSLLRSATGVGSQMVLIVAAGFPALTSAICFTSQGPKALSLAGKVSLLVLVIGVIDGFIISLFLDPAAQGRHMIGGFEAIKLMQDSALSSLKVCFTYLMLLAGLKLEVQE
jgi:hypothetical protein